MHERESGPDGMNAFFGRAGRRVLTFLGYSGAGYQDPVRLLADAGGVLAGENPGHTIVNAGATADGIGQIYELARAKGFVTSGIVSSLARDAGTSLSPFVDRVFFVEDDTWGGCLPGTDELSPTSAAMVGVSDSVVAIGGGQVTADELAAAIRMGLDVRFFPADLDHQRAIDAAEVEHRAAPINFSGAAARAWATLRSDPT